MTPPGLPAAPLSLGTVRGRGALVALVTASGTAFLDSSVVAVALPAIQRDLGGGLAALQWVVDAYLLTLGACLLVGGSLGDLLGKRRVFLAGLVSFGIASLLCAAAPTSAVLVAARSLQGVAAALMIPGSLSVITVTFDDAERPRVIGLWGGLSGLFTLLGPFVGGLLVDSGPSGWRYVFGVNPPLLLVACVLTVRFVPDLPGNRSAGSALAQVDVVGGVLTVIGLGLVAGSLIEHGVLGGATTAALVGAGLVVLAGFAVWERRCERDVARGGRRRPMLAPSLFAVRSFAVANLVTLGRNGRGSAGRRRGRIVGRRLFPSVAPGRGGLPPRRGRRPGLPVVDGPTVARQPNSAVSRRPRRSSPVRRTSSGSAENDIRA